MIKDDIQNWRECAEQYRREGRHDLAVHCKGIITKLEQADKLIDILKVMEVQRAKP